MDMKVILKRYRDCLFYQIMARYGGQIRNEINLNHFAEYRCQLDYSQASIILFIDNFLDNDRPTLQTEFDPSLIFKEIEDKILGERGVKRC